MNGQETATGQARRLVWRARGAWGPIWGGTGLEMVGRRRGSRGRRCDARGMPPRLQGARPCGIKRGQAVPRRGPLQGSVPPPLTRERSAPCRGPIRGGRCVRRPRTLWESGGPRGGEAAEAATRPGDRHQSPGRPRAGGHPPAVPAGRSRGGRVASPARGRGHPPWASSGPAGGSPRAR